jgi:hypothetical protein
MPGRCAFSPEQSHNSRHGSDTAVANEYMIHHSVIAWSVWAALQLSGLLAAIFALYACGSLSTPRF